MPYSKEYHEVWYKKNRTAISEKRKEKYRSDPQLRERAIQSSLAYRAKQRKTPPAGYTVTFEKAALLLGVTEWVLRAWRKKGYYPAPLKMGRCLYYTEHQIELLQRLKTLFLASGTRRAMHQEKQTVEDTVNLIYANWN